MLWVPVTYENVLGHLPTDVKAAYTAWLGANPDRTERLATITANTVREFRDAIISNRSNVIHEDDTYLPQSAVRHAEAIIVHSLAMEMGLTLASAGNSARVSADVFLRSIPYGRWKTSSEDETAVPGPHFSTPATSGRTLPLVLALILFASRSLAGWIEPSSGPTYDTQLATTFTPTAYSITTATLFGHLQGINAAVAQALSGDFNYSSNKTYQGTRTATAWNLTNAAGPVVGSVLFTPNLYTTTVQSTTGIYSKISGVITVTPTNDAETINFPGDSLTVDGLAPVRSSTMQSIFKYAIWGIGNIRDTMWSTTVTASYGVVLFNDTNDLFIITNNNYHAISRVSFATTNTTPLKRIDDHISVRINGIETQTISPPCDGNMHDYNLSTYAFLGDVLSLHYKAGAPNPNGQGEVYFKVSHLVTFPVPIIYNPNFFVEASCLANSNRYGYTIDFHGQSLKLDEPEYDYNPATKFYADSVGEVAIATANAETATRTGPTDFSGYNVRFNPRYDAVTESNALAIKYAGQTVMRFDGEGAAVTPEIKAFQVESGDVATMTVWSYSGGASNLLPEVCTNLTLGVWDRLTNSVISATNTDEYTAQVVFTNSLAVAAFVRLVDVSGGTGIPVTHFYGSVGINGDVQTAWPAGGTGTSLGNTWATNTPSAGQMLYASGANNSNLYWAAAPTGGSTYNFIAGSNVTIGVTTTNITINANPQAGGGGGLTTIPPVNAASNLIAETGVVTVPYTTSGSLVYLMPVGTYTTTPSIASGFVGIGKAALIFQPGTTNTWAAGAWTNEAYITISQTTNTYVATSFVATPLGTSRVETLRWVVP